MQLYRDEDTVEKGLPDHQHVVKLLRAVYDYADAQVEAHVTLCIGALLLERTGE